MEDGGQSHTFGKGIANLFSLHYEGIIFILPPIIFSPVYVFSDDKLADGCLYLLLIMIVYWISEVIPLGVTSMLPILGFPVIGIMSTRETTKLYFKDTLAMFITSIMVATSIEYSKLHIRLALRVLQLVGCSPRRLHFGICIVTSFLSMWIANAACTAMMCPIIYAVLSELSEQGLVKQFDERDADLPKDDRRPSNMASCFYLSVTYAASIGGLGSLIGTPTNLAIKNIYETRFEKAEDHIHFATWMAYTIPPVIVCTVLMYLLMEVVFMGLFRPNSEDGKEANIGDEGALVGRQVIDRKYEELGSTTIHEISVAILFVFLIMLYVFRDPGFVAGWVTEIFDNKGIKNSAPTVGILMLLFILPANYKFLKFWDEKSLEPTPSLLNWDFVVPKVPWGLIFLVGGGGVLAGGSSASGMATKLGNGLSVLEVLPPTIVLFIVITAAVLMTNFSANVAICNITLPVLAEMAVAMKVHPLYMIYPVGMGCSIALLLPPGTPPNAIVQGYCNLPTKTMIIGGLLPSLACIIVFWLTAQTYSYVIYPNFSEYPAWADIKPNASKTAIPDWFG